MSFRFSLKERVGLYVVTADYQERTHLGMAKAAVAGGARIIQYREKSASSRVMLETAMRLRAITAASGALLIINDRVDIALAVNADGVHLGQDDMPCRTARELMGDGYIIGISATNFAEAIEAAHVGADYIGLGPIYPTMSKDDAAPAMGIEGLVKVVAAVSVPVVAIGGLTSDNIGGVIAAGADGIATISAIAGAADMENEAKLLNDMIERFKQEHMI
ncbi:MAG: thiamine-phosphate diphosphorylase [Candidatus Aquicultor primus]|uniref:Thiamine-phosphate synthase n=1 Tax=Candidatus Aquicultor primus TaxID=1797195 RepID=A0A1F2UHE5_9ACTN|nr:MAG: thiamine-phosphate diphosphorylase [Candidatus Aquicultor primus]